MNNLLEQQLRFFTQKQKGFLFTLGIIDRMSAKFAGQAAKFAGKAAKFDKFSNLDGLFVIICPKAVL